MLDMHLVLIHHWIRGRCRVRRLYSVVQLWSCCIRSSDPFISDLFTSVSCTFYSFLFLSRPLFTHAWWCIQAPFCGVALRPFPFSLIYSPRGWAEMAGLSLWWSRNKGVTYRRSVISTLGNTFIDSTFIAPSSLRPTSLALDTFSQENVYGHTLLLAIHSPLNYFEYVSRWLQILISLCKPSSSPSSPILHRPWPDLPSFC